MSALLKTWALRWALIVFVGGIVPALKRWGLLARYVPQSVERARRLTALVAVVLCLSSAPLLWDTFEVEAEHANAIKAVPCEVGDSMWWGRLSCRPGKAVPERAFTWLGASVLPGTRGTLVYLPHSDTAIAFLAVSGSTSVEP